MAGANEPGLQQRIVRRQREERQPDRDREQAEQPERIARRRRLAPAARDRQRQRQYGDRQQQQMHRDRNHAVAELHQIMRVGIAAEQQRLKEHHRHRPHRRRAAEPRQHHLGEQRLHRKQQQRAGKDGGGIDDQDQPVAGIGRLIGRIGRSHESSQLEPGRRRRRAQWSIAGRGEQCGDGTECINWRWADIHIFAKEYTRHSGA